MKDCLNHIIFSIIVLLLVGFSPNLSIAQNIKRKIIVLNENDSIDNTIQIDLVYNEGHRVSYYDHYFELDTATTDSLLYVQVILEGDTLSFCGNNEKMFTQMPEIRTSYFESYRRQFVNSPVIWELVVDKAPYGLYYGENHNELFEDQIKKCDNGIVYHLKNTNSHLNFVCKDD